MDSKTWTNQLVLIYVNREERGRSAALSTVFPMNCDLCVNVQELTERGHSSSSRPTTAPTCTTTALPGGATLCSAKGLGV